MKADWIARFDGLDGARQLMEMRRLRADVVVVGVELPRCCWRDGWTEDAFRWSLTYRVTMGMPMAPVVVN